MKITTFTSKVNEVQFELDEADLRTLVIDSISSMQPNLDKSRFTVEFYEDGSEEEYNPKTCALVTWKIELDRKEVKRENSSGM